MANKFNLPDMCYVELPSTKEAVVVKYGESGYWPMGCGTPAMELNKILGVSEAEMQAMLIGSMMGWDVPGVNPKLWEKEGTK